MSESEDRYLAQTVDDVLELRLDVIELETILYAEADPARIFCVKVTDASRPCCAVAATLWMGEGAVDEICGAGCNGVKW